MKNLLSKVWALINPFQDRTWANEHGQTEPQFRLNPLNPISYLTAAVVFIILVICSLVQFFKEEWSNPFKWQ